MDAQTRDFEYEGHRLVFDDYGAGERVVVLLPGLLFSRRMHRPLAETLADRGHRVLSLDLLGHGDSDRPPEMFNYGMQLFARQAVALLDHLEIERAVVGGTSLGANVALEVAALAPERAQGLLIEMPVLDNALLGCAIAFTPLMIALTFRSLNTQATRSSRSVRYRRSRRWPSWGPDPSYSRRPHCGIISSWTWGWRARRAS